MSHEPDQDRKASKAAPNASADASSPAPPEPPSELRLPPPPPLGSELPSVVPRSPEEGLSSALDALLPSERPNAAPSPSPAPAASSPQSPSTPPGLLSSVLMRADAPHDHGAQAAYHSIPRRSGIEPRLPHVGGDPAAEQAHAELLEHLAEQAQGARRGELLTAAAERWQRCNQPARSLGSLERAHAENPEDPVALRELRKQALLARDLKRARALLLEELALALTDEERSLALTLLAELELAANADLPAAERAAEQAFASKPNVSAGLLLHELHLRAGRLRKAAQMLERIAEHWPEARAQAALLLEAGRLTQADAKPGPALQLFERAQRADPELLEAALCGYRAARELGDAGLALAALERLEHGLLKARASEDLARMRARLLDAQGRTAEALPLLGTAYSRPGLRLRARLSERLGDTAGQRAALLDYANAAGGSERALALLGLAELAAAEGDFAAAGQTLRQAAEADARLSLVRTLESALARAAGDPSGFVKERGSAGVEERLEAAARIASEPAGAARELELLSEIALASHSAALISLDAGCELGQFKEVALRVAYEYQRAAPAQRFGLELVLADLKDDHAAGEPPPLRARLGGAQHVGLIRLVRRIDRESQPEALGALWLELAAELRGEAAAAYATLAGDYLRAQTGAREAYERALSTVPGYVPACFALEPLLHATGDRAALRRLHAALSRTSEDPLERAARATRIALQPEIAPDQARGLLRDLARLAPSDALLWDRRALEREALPALDLAEMLEGAGRSASDPLSLVARLRAASLYEQAGEPARAAVLYREALDLQRGDEPHAELGLPRALARAGLTILLVEHLERLEQSAPTALARAEALERLALLQRSSGDERHARASFAALLELAPLHPGALCARQQEAMGHGELDALALCAERLAQRDEDARERAAQLRLLARARQLTGSGAPAGDESAPKLGLLFALAEERRARAASDPEAIAAAVLELCSAHISDPNERASYAMRAAEALGSVSSERAAHALEAFAAAAPDHALVHEALARLRHAASDPAGAARAYEQAAAAAPTPQRRVRQLYRAAVLWQDSVADDARARAALQAVVAIDVLYRDAFERLERVLKAKQDEPARAALLEQRIRAGAEPRVLSDLHAERARLLMAEGRRAEAKAALRAALELDPQRIEALRGVAELEMQGGQWREAAEALIRVARLAKEPSVLRETFLALGRIYTEQLPDPRRAEIAYARAVGIDPNDAFAIERLLDVFRQRKQLDHALRACERLIELARDEAEADRRTVELASVLEDKGELMRAERALNDRREHRPGSGLILSALSDFYARQREDTALQVHLDRSIHALRRAILEDPDEGSSWNALADALARRGRAHAAECVAAIARDLGFADARSEQLAARFRPLGGDAFSPAVMQRVWPVGLREAARELLAWLDPRSAELLPDARQRELLQATPPAVRRALDQARICLEIPKLELFAVDGRECFPLRSKPLGLAIGRELIRSADADELTFLVLRALSIARFQLGVAVRTPPAELAALLESARAAALPGAAAVRGLSPRQSRDLAALYESAAKAPGFDPGTLRELTLLAGAQVALCALCSLPAALSALGGAGAKPAEAGYEGRDLGSLIGRSAEARALLGFAISDAHIELRSQLDAQADS